jgi:hypothetical protein
MGNGMSFFSQFGAADSFLGEFISGSNITWGSNPIFAGKEFLQTGFVKTYSSDYAVLASNFPQAVINSQVETSGASWNPGALGSVAIGGRQFFESKIALFYLGGNYHQIIFGATAGMGIGASAALARYGTSITGTATGGVTPLNEGEGGSSDTADIYSSAILYCTINGSTTTYKLWRSTGTTYSDTYTLPNAGPWTLSSSPSLVIGFSGANANTTTAGSVITSTNGTSWTSTNTSANVTPTSNERQSRLVYSTAGGNFILVTTLGNIFTSTNGTTWTSQTKPSEMPASVPFIRGNNIFLAAKSATATLISVGEGKFIRTTDGTTFTLINLSVDPGVNAWFPSNSTIEITYDGTNFIIMNPTLTAFGYSLDDGLTFQIDYQKLVKQTSPTTFRSHSLQYTNSKFWYYMVNGLSNSVFAGSTAYDLDTRVIRSNPPQFVGTTIAVTFATGSTLSVYLRVK